MKVRYYTDAGLFAEEESMMEGRQSAKPKEPALAPPAKKPYNRPFLAKYGDVRDLTLGTTAGLGESGNPTLYRP